MEKTMMNIAKLKKGTFSYERNHDYTKDKNPNNRSRLNFWKEFIGVDVDNENVYYKWKGIQEDELSYLLENDNFDIIYNPSLRIWEQFINDLESKEYDEVVLPQLEWFNTQKEMDIDPPFINFYKPFLKIALCKFKKQLNVLINRSNNKINISDDVIKQFLQSLSNKLFSLCSRVLNLELNMMREENKLKGADSEEKAKYYSDVLLKDKNYTLSILQRYPVMYRLISNIVNNWLINNLELIARYIEDRDVITEKFNSNRNIGELVSITSGLSYDYNDGKSVTILEFSTGFTIVYKPRSLQMDIAFNNFLSWFNTNKMGIKLYEMNILSRDNYGWMEFVEDKPCNNKEEAQLYYKKMGSLLCILHIFRATNVNHENIIAHGFDPVIIDIEAILQNRWYKKNDKTSIEKISNRIEMSVKSMGILPSLIMENNVIKGVDVSALGGNESQEISITVPTIQNLHTEQNIDTDHEKIDCGLTKLKESKNGPHINNHKIDVFSYKNIILKSYIETYEYLIKRKIKEKLSLEIEKFSNITSRQIIRPTKKYASILSTSTHPDFLRDGLDREMLIERLFIESVDQDKLLKALRFELKDLLKNDIPYFLNLSKDRDLYHNDKIVYKDFFAISNINLAISRINNMNYKDLDLQKKIIDLSFFGSFNRNNKGGSIINVKELSDEIKNNIREEYLEIAIEIGDHLIDFSCNGDDEGEEDVDWYTMNIIGENELAWHLTPAGLDLYNGVVGIAMFFAYIYNITKEIRYFNMLTKCIVTLKKNINRLINNRKKEGVKNPNIGGYNGDSSIIYGLQAIRSVVHDEELEELCDILMDGLICQIENDNNYDIVSGAAGCILVMLNYYDKYNSSKALDIAIKCGEHLLDSADREEDMLKWKPYIASSPLAGFSHGASGISLALYLLGKKLDDNKYIESAYKSLAFERTLFIKELGTWADQRVFKGKTNHEMNIFPTAWCHGAPGILLSRVVMNEDKMSVFNSSEINNELEIALNTTIHNGLGQGHCLCHGDLGNLCILKYASKHLEDKKELLDKVINCYSIEMLKKLKNGIWECGIPNNYENPGLMLGLAGIAYGLLYLYDSEDIVPDVLMLQSK